MYLLQDVCPRIYSYIYFFAKTFGMLIWVAEGVLTHRHINDQEHLWGGIARPFFEKNLLHWECHVFVTKMSTAYMGILPLW